MLAIALLCPAPTWGQEPDGDDIDTSPAVIETNPAVRAALELPREEPADYFQAIVWLIDLERPELAKPILEELTKLQLTDAQRVTLVSEFGSRDMLRLSRAKELAPTGASFADACMAAAAAAANDPQRIATLVAQLTDASPEIRQIARTDLAATGQAGVTATLEALAKETNSGRRELLASAASRMHPLAIGPLLAMLDTNDPVLRLEVAKLLERFNVLQAAPLLQGDTSSAERALVSAMENLRQGAPPFQADEANQVELWHWDDATKKLTSAQYPVEEARIVWMSRMAGELAAHRPDVQDYQRQALLLGLEAAQLGPTTRSSAASQARAANLHLLNEVLADALEAGFAHAALAVIEELGSRGNAGVLLTLDSKPSPLADALVHRNRRVRFAALRTIMQLDPSSPYPGSSRVPDALAWFAGGRGERQAVVAMPTLAAASHLAGMLAAHELDAQATNRGREAVDLARDAADLEMILVDMNIQTPAIRQVVYELRISPATGETPIALLAAEGRLKAAETLAAEHERVIAVSRPHSKEVVARIIERLASLTRRGTVSAEERVAQAAEAQAWLEKLSASRPFYTIRRTARLDSTGAQRELPAPQP